MSLRYTVYTVKTQTKEQKMIRYNPPHEVRDQEKLNSMIKLLEAGKTLPPILVNGYDAYCGSHRLAAWDAMDMDALVIELDDDEYLEVCKNMGLDPVYDRVTEFEDFLQSAKDLNLDGGAQ